MEITVTSKDDSNSVFVFLEGSNENSLFLKLVVEKYVNTVTRCTKRNAHILTI